MNYFKAAEQLLSAVPTLERALENLQKRQQRLIDKGAPKEPSIDYSKPFCDSHYVSDTLGELLELSECVGNIAKTKETLAAIESVINQLNDEQKKLVTLWYIKKLAKEAIMEEMYIGSLATLYNLRNKAVADFALLYYGAAAIDSI